MHSRLASFPARNYWYEVNSSECTCTKYLEYDSNTVEPPNKGHFGDNINSDVVSFVERLSSLRRFKKYGKQIFGTLTCGRAEKSVRNTRKNPR